MRLLLFFICFLFSFIFFIFYKINLGENIFGINLGKIKIESFSGNLMIDSLFIFLIGFFLIGYFSKNFKIDFFISKIEKNKKIFYITFYFLLFLSIFSSKIFFDIIILFGIIFLIFSDFCFNYLSNLESLKEQKNNLRYFGLFLNFISIFISIYYIFKFDFSFLLFLVLIFNLFFNYFIYKKYKNIICLIFIYSIIIFILIFFILKLYYLSKIFLIF